MARKVLFYTHAFSGGGAEVVFGRLARAFAEAGDDVIFAADYTGPVAMRDGPNLRHIVLGAAHASATARLAALLRAEKPDASFSALGGQNLKHLTAALLAGRRHRCILGYHGFADAEPKLLSRLSFWATAVITRLAARTICVSDALLADVRCRWRGSTRRTIRIYNPLPPATDQPPRGAKEAPPLIVGCGRLAPVKRFQDLVAALAAVQPPDTRLAILGAGPEQANIEAAIIRLGMQDRVDLTGHVADPTPWYGRAACLAIASSSESFGLTAAEALAQGLPVVTTACGGPPEILAQGRYGRIVPVGDVAALAAALSLTIFEPPNSAILRARADMFALPAIQRAYADLIDSLP